MSPRLKQLLLALCRVGLGMAFLWAAATKLPDLQLFAEEMANYRILPAALVPAAAVALVGVEIVAGALMVTGVAARAAAAVIGALLLVFIAGLSAALVRGIDLRCGCFGGTENATWGTVVRDVLMLVPCIPVVLYGGGRLRFWKAGPPAGVAEPPAAAR